MALWQIIEFYNSWMFLIKKILLIVTLFGINISYATESQMQNDSDLSELHDVVKPEITEEKQHELDNLLNRGKFLFEERKLDEAFSAYEEALLIIEDYKLTSQKLQLLLDLANIEYAKNTVLPAIKYFLQALQISKDSDDEQHLAYIYSRLSYLYYANDPSLAKTYLEFAIKQNIKNKARKDLAENYYNLALIEKRLGFLDRAKISEENYEKYKKYVAKHDFFKLSDIEQSSEYKYNIIAGEGFLQAEFGNIQILNKINGFTYSYQMKVGAKISFKNIDIIMRNCFKSAPEISPEDLVLLDVYERKLDEKESIFKGWMFSSTPSLNSLEHAIYDIRLINCELKRGL